MDISLGSGLKNLCCSIVIDGELSNNLVNM